MPESERQSDDCDYETNDYKNNTLPESSIIPLFT